MPNSVNVMIKANIFLHLSKQFEQLRLVELCRGCRKIKMEGLPSPFAPPNMFRNTPGESLCMLLLTYLVKSPYVFIGYKQMCMGKIVKEKLCSYFVINCVTIKRTYLSCG